MNPHALFVAGRSLIAISFIVSAIGKSSNWKDTIALMQMHQMPWPTVGLACAILIEIVGGVSLLIGTLLYPTGIALFAYVVLATVFVPLQDALKNRERGRAVPMIGSNVAILGGLALVLALKAA